MNRLKYIVLYLAVLHFFVQAQDYNELVNYKENLLKETTLLNQTLLETSQTKSYTVEKLNIINTKIGLQEELLDIYQKSINILSLEQSEIEDTIIIVSNYLEKLKQNYANLIQISHRSLIDHNRILFFLSAQSFNQLIRRIYHFNQLVRQRYQKYKEIEITREQLDNKKKLVLEKKASQAEVILNQKKQIKLLQKTKLNQEEAIRVLKNKTDSLTNAIKIKERETKNITQIILDLVELEKSKKTDSEQVLNLISSDFQSNKGKLPWPVKRGSVVSKFGKVAHPVLAGITLMNNGIEIATKNNSVRSVFDGEVSKIIVLPTGLKVVIIKHGRYLTVYSNLKNTQIQKGQKIKTLDIIGVLNEDDNTKHNLLGFQIWNGREKLNPTHWISSN